MGSIINVNISDRIATVMMNRPEAGNSLNEEMFAALEETFGKLAKDENVNCIVLTGNGKNFSTGGDINWFKENLDKGEEIAIMAASSSKAILTCPKPVIGMINGAAVGAGFSLALACDLRVVTESTLFSMTFINMALTVDTSGFYHLAKILGLGRAMDLSLTAEPIRGKDAINIGLATRWADEGKLAEVTYALAHKMADRPMKTIRLQKQLAADFYYADLITYTNLEKKALADCFQSSDAIEAISAFLEKRKPRFTCR